MYSNGKPLVENGGALLKKGRGGKFQYTMPDVRNRLKDTDITCLSPKCSIRLKLQCSYKHPIFERSYGEIKLGISCPACNKLERLKMNKKLKNKFKETGLSKARTENSKRIVEAKLKEDDYFYSLVRPAKPKTKRDCLRCGAAFMSSYLHVCGSCGVHNSRSAPRAIYCLPW